MLFVKSVGALALFVCGALTSVMLCVFEKKRCRQANAFLLLIRHIRVQIECFNTPVERILQTLDPRVRIELCAPPEAKDMPELLERTPLFLPRELCLALREFATALGTGYREDEIRFCEHSAARIEPLVLRLNEELEKRVKLAVLLPLSLACVLILLLW